jgi:RNA polymerase sigma factor (TIGR02999 family)
MSQNVEVTRLLTEWTGGNREALDALMPLVMNELKRIAGAYLSRESHPHTLQTTALVNEAYLRLVTVEPRAWESRAQFFALAAQIMRRILVDHARAQLGAKRGGRVPHLALDSLAVAAEPTQAVTRLDQALLDLERLDARKGRIAELRVFGGLSHAEIAHVLGLSERTVLREWRFSKAWLGRELNQARADG